jgi:hypothetical protein
LHVTVNITRDRMTQTKSGKYRMLKWTGGVVAVLIVILASAGIYINAKWKPFLTEIIKQGVYESSKHLYRLNFDDLHINLLAGSVTFDSLKLSPDTAVYNRLRERKLAPLHIYDVKMERLRLTHIGFYTAYKAKRINMKAIILDHASINVIHHKVPRFQDTTKVEKTLYEQISKTLKSIHVGSIKVLDADLDFVDGDKRKTLNSVKHLNINVSDVLVDSLSQYDTTRFYYAKNVDLNVAGYKSVSKDKMYTFKVDSVSGSVSKGSLSIKNFRMVPMYSEMAFSKKYGIQKDRFDLKIKSIKIRGFDFARVNSEGLFHANALSIGPAKIKIFKNKEVKPGVGSRREKFPQLALQNIELPLIVDTLLLRNVDVTYTAYNPIPEKRGTVHIGNIRGRLLNVTNDSLQLSKHQHLIANVKARFNQAIDLNLRLDFDLRAKDGAFTYSGNIGSFDMRALNPIAVALGMVSIQSGHVQKMDFNVRANKLGAHGSLHMYYTDLKVTLLKEGEEGEPMKKKKILSLLANTLVIKDSNPSGDNPLRVGLINYKRLPRSAFSSLLWNGVFSGMRESIGLSGVKSKPPIEAYKKVVEKLAERKERRQERREKRQKDRQEKQ